ncbi:hypothetical protein [Leptospira kirschneri]|uniref:hypothetical protein n=1 Tax=Leptospira kirschneri TaxID=29507 RepID=UPI0002D45E54|nr:hypothetical protein [Leptospira kirschneri]OOV42896.1 hypothetical protein B1J94_19265 [Leptospira kirschneri serovar Grippotyphosa]UZW36107.1 hypothetical protein ORQ95_16100 [Leptospira kirschneri]WBF94464.1 hypothetical protein LIX31_16325 [Leptospira kirschneri]WHO99806.1 hypothetical protein QMK36_16130 [Leptospira kirschneri]
MKFQIKIFTLGVLGVILSLNCIVPIGSRRTLVKRNPMPYPTNSVLSPENHVSVAGTYFRDPSIHYGNASTRLRLFGFDGFIHSTSSLPHKDMFHGSLDDWDWSKHRIIRFEGESQGCQRGVTLILPLRQGERETLVPISFVFGKTSFYEELKQEMEKNKIKALFDSKLDIEQTAYLFWLIQKKCIRFKSYAIQEF